MSYDNARLYVPAESLETYKKAYGWKGFSDIRVITDEITLNGITYVLDHVALTASAKGADSTATMLEIPSTINEGSTTYNVTAIEDEGFKNFKALTSITIPQGITSIGERAFQNCEALVSITIHYPIAKIASGTFENCYSLRFVNLPYTIEEIEADAFFNTYSLAEVICRAVEPPTCATNAFGYSIQKATLYVQDRYADGYIKADVWKDFGKIVGKSPEYYVGIEAIENGGATEKARYTTDGTRITAPQRGINIIKMSDGTTRKVLVK